MEKRWLFGIWIALALVLTISGPTGCKNPTPIASVDEASIYAAVVRQLATVDDTFGGNLKPPKLFIIRNTDDKVAQAKLESAPAAPSAFIPENMQIEIAAALHDLPSVVVWIDKFADAEFEAGNLTGPPMNIVKDGGAIITLGNIRFRIDGSVQLPGSIYIGNLAAMSPVCHFSMSAIGTTI